MKKQKSKWYQPEGWLSFGAIVVVAVLVVYLIFMVVRMFLPRLQKIDRMYNQEDALLWRPPAASCSAPATRLAGRRTGTRAPAVCLGIGLAYSPGPRTPS